MTEEEHATIGAPCWVDLMTSDTDRSRAFYGELFGWTALEAAEEFGGYFMFTQNDVPVAGCTPSEGHTTVAESWSVYLTSDDARKTAAVAEAGGSHIVVPAMDVGDLGTMAMVTDTGGAAIGIWQPRGFKGFVAGGGPGTPAWFEVHTRDYQAVVAFYRDVFGWDTRTMSDTADFRYTTLAEGEQQRAGIMDAAGFLPDGVPAQWFVYFAVEDTDVAVAKVVDLGGSIAMPAEDTPFGRLATVADSNGAAFKLVAGGEEA